jgi:hypothetical protein
MMQVIAAAAIVVICFMGALDMSLLGSRQISILKARNISIQYVENYSALIQISVLENGGVKKIELLPQVITNVTDPGGEITYTLDPTLLLPPDTLEKNVILNGKNYDVKCSIEFKKYEGSLNKSDYAVITSDLIEQGAVRFTSKRVLSR